MSFRQVCKIIKSETGNKKITIEVDGKILKVEKVIGLDFRPGDYACYQTFDGFKKSLVVALNPEEIKELKLNEDHDSANLGQADSTSSSEDLDFPSPDIGVVPLDEEIFKSQLEDEQNKKQVIAEDINDKVALDTINSLFADELTEKEEEDAVRRLFPMVAIQQGEEGKKMKETFYQKADDIMMRKLINEQSNREVHKFLSSMINRIDDEKDHEEFFHNLSFYLDRLKKMQRKKRLSAKKMGVIFYPVYIYYVRKFTREKIDEWISSKDELPLNGFE